MSGAFVFCVQAANVDIMNTKQGRGSLVLQGQTIPVTYRLRLESGGASGTLEMPDGGLSLINAPPVCVLTLENGKQLRVNVQLKSNVVVVTSSGPVDLG